MKSKVGSKKGLQYDVFMHPYSQNFDVIVKMVKEQVIFEKANFVLD